MYNKGDVRLFRPWSIEPQDFDAEHPGDNDGHKRSFTDRGNTNVRSSASDSILDEIIGSTDRAASSLTTLAGKRAKQPSVEARTDRSRVKDEQPSPVTNKDSELLPPCFGVESSCRSVRAIPTSNLSIPLIAGFVVDNDGSVFHSTYQRDCLLGVNVFHSSMMDRVLNRVAGAPGQSSVTSMPHGLYTPMAMEQAVEMLHRQDAAAKQMKKQRPKRFRCEHCDVAFSNNGQLKGHVRIHTGECFFIIFLPRKKYFDNFKRSIYELIRNSKFGVRSFEFPNISKRWSFDLETAILASWNFKLATLYDVTKRFGISRRLVFLNLRCC